MLRLEGVDVEDSAVGGGDASEERREMELVCMYV